MISEIHLSGQKKKKQEAREELARNYDPKSRIEKHKLLELCGNICLQKIAAKVAGAQPLTFEEAMVGMSHVIAATNKRVFEILRKPLERGRKVPFGRDEAIACGASFLTAMAMREALVDLTPEEVAGIATAGLIDTIIRLPLLHVIETCGMGGDPGFHHNGTTWKTINASTLSSIVLASLGLPVIKHGSYANTSVMGSTETIEMFGANTTMRSEEEIMRIWEACKYCYLDAHLTKTLHDLSHLLLIETINHIVGPMSLPVSPDTEVTKLMGVNEKIHPSIIARAYTLLHRRGIQKMGGVAIVAGLDESGFNIDPANFDHVRDHTTVDELSPFASVVSLAHQGTFLGNFLVTPEDFGVELNPNAVQIPNEKETIHLANMRAIRGEDIALTDYLAMNAALGLFAERHLGVDDDAVTDEGVNCDYLRQCTEECREAIQSGAAWRKLVEYVETSGGKIAA